MQGRGCCVAFPALSFGEVDTMIRILVVEDDRDMNHSVCMFLQQNGYKAIGCLNVQEAYDQLFKNGADLIISDIMMPGTDGFSFARQIRSENTSIPILFMSARDDFAAKEKGFRLGIDDYMTKPVDLDELLLRISALLRRSRIAEKHRIVLGNVRLEGDEHAAYIGDEEIPLTSREFEILFKLLSYPRKTFSRTQLMDEFWDSDADTGTRTVDVYMTRIRNKFLCTDAFSIVTVRGLGYKAVIKESTAAEG